MYVGNPGNGYSRRVASGFRLSGNPVKAFAASAAEIRRGAKLKLCLQEFLLSTKMVGNPLRFL